MKYSCCRARSVWWCALHQGEEKRMGKSCCKNNYCSWIGGEKSSVSNLSSCAAQNPLTGNLPCCSICAMLFTQLFLKPSSLWHSCRFALTCKGQPTLFYLWKWVSETRAVERTCPSEHMVAPNISCLPFVPLYTSSQEWKPCELDELGEQQITL